MRQQISLNGRWDFVADLDPKYHAIHGGFHNPAANRRNKKLAFQAVQAAYQA